jgi:hypothetical protein
MKRVKAFRIRLFNNLGIILNKEFNIQNRISLNRSIKFIKSIINRGVLKSIL